MLGRNSSKPQTTLVSQDSSAGPASNGGPLLTIVGASAKLEGKFEITDSIQIECEVGGELSVGGKLVIGEKLGDRGQVHVQRHRHAERQVPR